MGDGAAAGSGAEAHWVSPAELNTVLSDCIALTTHKGLILARTRTFQHTPWNSLDLHHVCVGSLTTKKLQLPSENLLFSIFLPKTGRCTSGKLLWLSHFDVALCTWAEVGLRSTDRTLSLKFGVWGCGLWRWKVLRLWFEGNHEMFWL